MMKRFILSIDTPTFNQFGMLTCVITIPPIPLPIKIQVDLLYDLIGFDVFAGPLGPLFPRPIHAIPRFVRHGAAVFAGTFSVFCRCFALVDIDG